MGVVRSATYLGRSPSAEVRSPASTRHQITWPPVRQVDDAGRISLVDDRPVTEDGSIDAGSSPSWFIPEAEQLPTDDGGAGPDSLEASTPDGQTAQGAP